MLFIALSDNEFIIALRDRNMEHCRETEAMLANRFPSRTFRCIPFTGDVEVLDMRNNPEQLPQALGTELAAVLAH